MNINKNTLVFKLSNSNTFSEIRNNINQRNFIADLTGVNLETLNKIKDKFITFDKTINKANGSFVIVSEFSFDESLVIVPTLQEAYDYIEMEEIEREISL